MTPTTQAWDETRKLLRTLFVTLAVGLTAWLLYSLQAIILLLVFAVFFAYLLAPVVEPMHQRFKVPRAASIGVVYVCLAAVAGLAGYTFLPRLVVQLQELLTQVPALISSIRARVPQIEQHHIDQAMALGERFAVSAVAGLAYAPWLVLIPVIAFFLLKDANVFRRSALQMLPEGRVRWRGQDFFEEVNRTLASFIRAQLTDCLIMAVLFGVSFWALGLPYAAVLAVFAGALEFLPLVGPMSSLAIVCLIAFTQGSLIPTFGVMVVLRMVNDYAIYPRLMAGTVGMHPLAIILAIMCGGTLMGLPGMFLAIPLTAVLSVGYRHAAKSITGEGVLAELLRPVNEVPDAPALAYAAPQDTPRLDGLKVLVVDNELDARTLLSHVLEKNGATVTAVGSAAEALEAVQRDRPHVLLSDIGMPSEDGFDFIRKLRALDAVHGGRIPAAALTGYATSEDRARALHAGFQVHLSKPCDPAELAHAVIKLARSAQN